MAGQRILFIINPIAGLGGPLGLRGTDEALGRRLLLERRVTPPAYVRGRRFLDMLSRLGCLDTLYTARWMGEELVREAGLHTIRVYEPPEWPTRSQDTFEAVRRGVEEYGVDTVVFVGGDGTSRLVYDALRASGRPDVVMIGVPAGVKMYGGIYAVTPEDAARALCALRRGEASVCEAEVMDIDEEAFRRNELRARLYGIARTVCGPGMVGTSKQPSPSSTEEEENKRAIARYVAERYFQECTLVVLGPGTTTAAIARMLGLPKTLLGVDVYHGKRVVALDVDEETLYRIVSSHTGRKVIIVTPIGGQGFILGRGNQQISPRVVRVVGPENIVVVATWGKMRSLGGRLRVDTGDPELDRVLRGYRRVIVDYGEELIARVE